MILELVLELFDLAPLIFELLLQFRVFGSPFVPSLLRLLLPSEFGFDGGRTRLGEFFGVVSSAGRNIVVRCASLGELGRKFCDLFLQLFDHATSADLVESVSLVLVCELLLQVLDLDFHFLDLSRLGAHSADWSA